MSHEAVTYVRRHLLVVMTSPQQACTLLMAHEANQIGRVWMTQPMLAAALGRSLAAVERTMRSLLRPATGDPVLQHGGGRTYVILGVAEHDSYTCWQAECQAEATGDDLAARRRAAAARRKRAERERRRASAAV